MKREHSPDEPLEAKKARLEASARSHAAQPANERDHQTRPTSTSSSRPASFLSPFRLGSWGRVGSQPDAERAEGDGVADATVTTSVVVRHPPGDRKPSDRAARRDWDHLDAVHAAPWRQIGHGGWREGQAGQPATRTKPARKPWWFFANRQRHEPRPPPPPPPPQTARVPTFDQDLVEKTAEQYLHAVKANKVLEGAGSDRRVMPYSTTGLLPMRWSFGPPISLQPARTKSAQPPVETNAWELCLPLQELLPRNEDRSDRSDADPRVSALEAQIAKLQQDAEAERSILKKQIHQLQTERPECDTCGRCETDLDLPLTQRFKLIKKQKMNLERTLAGRNQTIQQKNRLIKSLQDQLNHSQQKAESGALAAMRKELAELKQRFDKLARSAKAK